MLDKLKPLARHLAILLLGAVLTWVTTEVVPSLQDQGGAAALIGAAITVAALYFTPLTSQYGIGAQ